jgi:hypothetical protein
LERASCHPDALGEFDGRIIFNGFATAKNLVIGYYGFGSTRVKQKSRASYPQDKNMISINLKNQRISLDFPGGRELSA